MIPLSLLLSKTPPTPTWSDKCFAQTSWTTPPSSPNANGQAVHIRAHVHAPRRVRFQICKLMSKSICIAYIHAHIHVHTCTCTGAQDTCLVHAATHFAATWALPKKLTESTPAHDAVAAALSHKHHPIIRIGAGLISLSMVCTCFWSQQTSSSTKLCFHYFFVDFSLWHLCLVNVIYKSEETCEWSH